MGALKITDADVYAEAEARGLEPGDLAPRQFGAIKRDLAQRAIDARKPPAPEPEAKGPDHLTVTVEITHGDNVLSVTQQHIPIPTR